MRMKDSGIEWIGEIPQDWKICRTKFLCDISTGNKDTINRVDDGYYPFFVRSKNIERIDTYSFDGEAVLTAGDGDIGKIFHYIKGKFDFHQRVYKLSGFKNIIGKYFYYYISVNFLKELDKYNAKTTVDSIRLPWLLNFPVLVPNIQEQQRIADFLDCKCERINNIIEKQQQVIEMLKLYKQSIITEIVTKGLNPNVTMKDSKIDWLDKIPQHWTVKRVKYLLFEINERSESGTEEPLSMSQKLGIVKSSDMEIPNPASSYVGNKKVYVNDLVFNKLKAHLGVFALSEYDGIVSPDYSVYRSYENVSPKYLEYLFKTPQCIGELKKYIRGVAAGLSRLYTGDLFSIKVPVPPFEEQKRISDFIADKCVRIDSAIEKKQKLIEKLADYKKSLIYEAVTGKLEV